MCIVQLPLLLEKHIAALEMLADFDLPIQASPAFTPETEKQLSLMFCGDSVNVGLWQSIHPG